MLISLNINTFQNKPNISVYLKQNYCLYINGHRRTYLTFLGYLFLSFILLTFMFITFIVYSFTVCVYNMPLMICFLSFGSHHQLTISDIAQKVFLYSVFWFFFFRNYLSSWNFCSKARMSIGSHHSSIFFYFYLFTSMSIVVLWMRWCFIRKIPIINQQIVNSLQ